MDTSGVINMISETRTSSRQLLIRRHSTVRIRRRCPLERVLNTVNGCVNIHKVVTNTGGEHVSILRQVGGRDQTTIDAINPIIPGLRIRRRPTHQLVQSLQRERPTATLVVGLQLRDSLFECSDLMRLLAQVAVSVDLRHRLLLTLGSIRVPARDHPPHYTEQVVQREQV